MKAKFAICESCEKHMNVVPWVRVVGLFGFESYGLIIDLRQHSEFCDDHIPGAICAKDYVDVFEELRAFIGDTPKNKLSTTAQQFIDVIKSDGSILAYGDPKPGVISSCICVLRQLGGHIEYLKGGYEVYRQWVKTSLTEIPEQFKFNVIYGEQACGQKAFIQALEDEGCQTFNPAKIIKSVINGGHVCTQKLFESYLLAQLLKLSEDRPVWTTPFDRLINGIQMPVDLMKVIYNPHIAFMLQVSARERVRFLASTNAHTDSEYERSLVNLNLHLDNVEPAAVEKIRTLYECNLVKMSSTKIMFGTFNNNTYNSIEMVSANNVMTMPMRNLSSSSITKAAKTLMAAAN